NASSPRLSIQESCASVSGVLKVMAATEVTVNVACQSAKIPVSGLKSEMARRLSAPNGAPPTSRRKWLSAEGCPYSARAGLQSSPDAESPYYECDALHDQEHAEHERHGQRCCDRRAKQ